VVARPKLHGRKGPACTICQHPDRARIEAVRCAGASLDSVAKKFGVSRDAVFRHQANHVDADTRSQYLSGVPVAELAQLAASEGTSVLEYLSLVRSVLVQEFQLASQTHSHHATSALAGRLVEVLRAIGSISGEMGNMATSLTINGNINVMNHPQLANLQANMLRALAPYPDARAAVVGALKAMDAEPVSASPPLIELQANDAV
jgi:hypothetical protein